jgi:hypothetical protein
MIKYGALNIHGNCLLEVSKSFKIKQRMSFWDTTFLLRSFNRWELSAALKIL